MGMEYLLSKLYTIFIIIWQILKYIYDPINPVLVKILNLLACTIILQIDENQDDSALSYSGSIQSFVEPQQPSSIIKPGSLDSTLFSAGIQSPDSDDRDLLIK